MELHGGARPLGCSALLQLRLGSTQRKLLGPPEAVSHHLHQEDIGEGVDDGDPDTMETAGNGVGTGLELATGMQRGEDGRNRRQTRLLVLVHRDTPAVVFDGHTVVFVDGDIDSSAETRHRLIHRVVDDLPDQVVKAARTGRPDIHGRALANRLETLENRDVLRLVRGRVLPCHCESFGRPVSFATGSGLVVAPTRNAVIPVRTTRSVWAQVWAQLPLSEPR